MEKDFWTPLWENSGNTPTRRLAIINGCGQAPNFRTWDAIWRAGLIGPKGTGSGQSCWLKTSDIALIQASRADWFVYGQVNYQDIFGHKHVTQYCAKLSWPNSGQDDYSFFTCDEGHNCADDECDGQTQGVPFSARNPPHDMPPTGATP